jgi:ActR/RegA family two-component response regulator
MTFLNARQPAIALVDDDYHSARLMTRTLEAHGAPSVSRMPDADRAVEQLAGMSEASDFLAVVDLKSSSTATRDFVERLKAIAPSMLVVAIAPSLDRETRGELIEAGAAAVFERHSDIALYRREAASIVDFWVRNQRLDRTGT